MNMTIDTLKKLMIDDDMNRYVIEIIDDYDELNIDTIVDDESKLLVYLRVGPNKFFIVESHRDNVEHFDKLAQHLVISGIDSGIEEINTENLQEISDISNDAYEYYVDLNGFYDVSEDLENII